MAKKTGFRLTIWNVNNLVSGYDEEGNPSFRLTIWNVNINVFHTGIFFCNSFILTM
ncbi:hypothetical protein ACP3U4_09195 [Clostridioides difficile]|nr:hypothetical protein QK3_1038 [Clostridioides difficile DA00145]